MDEQYFVGAYWMMRSETMESCARRMETFLRMLAGVDPVFTQWYERANSLKEALQLRFEPTYDTLVRLLKKRSYKKEGGRFSFAAWTGNEEDHGGMFMVRCGDTEPLLPNTCIFYLPSAEPEAGRIASTPGLTGVMRALAVAWEPEWAVATSELHRDTVSPDYKASTYIGWLMYYSRARGVVPPLPEPVRVEPVEDKGTLVTLTPERFTVSNAEHVALAERVRQVLEPAGLLKPLLP